MTKCKCGRNTTFGTLCVYCSKDSFPETKGELEPESLHALIDEEESDDLEELLKEFDA